MKPEPADNFFKMPPIVFLSFVGVALMVLYLMDDPNSPEKEAPAQRHIIYYQPIATINSTIDSSAIVGVLLTQSSPTDSLGSTMKLSDSVYFATMRQRYNSDSSHTRQRKDITIRYYKKNADQHKVRALEKLGFYIHERETERHLQKYPTNALYFGDSVQSRDIMLIAYSLINQGMVFNKIGFSKYHDTWKNHAIELATDTTLINNSAITLSEIRKRWGDL